MDIIKKFETNRVERIRQAITAYQKEFDIRDTKMAKEIAPYLDSDIQVPSITKNVERLRKGNTIRSIEFLNACVKFLEANRPTPPEEELGFAMKRFIGGALMHENIWDELRGDYALTVIGESTPDLSGDFLTAAKPASGLTTRPDPLGPAQTMMFLALSIEKGVDPSYGSVNERYYFPIDESSEEELGEQPDAQWRNRKGICLPVGGQDFLIMLRDFTLSHMYVLRREENGFSGTMIMPPPSDILSVASAGRLLRSQYEVVLKRALQ